MGLVFRYFQPGGQIEPMLSIMYARAYRDWFPFDLDQIAPALSAVWWYKSSVVDPQHIAGLVSDVDRVLEQPSLCPWGESMERKIRQELGDLKELLNSAADRGLSVRVSGLERPREISFYVRLNDGRLDEPFAATRWGSGRLSALAEVAGRADTVLTRVWKHGASPALSVDDARLLAAELDDGRADPFVLAVIETCESAAARGLGVHVAGGSYGEGLQISLFRGGRSLEAPHPGLNASLSVAIPSALSLVGKVWDYADNVVENADLAKLAAELGALLNDAALSAGMRSNLLEAEFLARLAQKHGLDLFFSGP